MRTMVLVYKNHWAILFGQMWVHIQYMHGAYRNGVHPAALDKS